MNISRPSSDCSHSCHNLGYSRFWRWSVDSKLLKENRRRMLYHRCHRFITSWCNLTNRVWIRICTSLLAELKAVDETECKLDHLTRADTCNVVVICNSHCAVVFLFFTWERLLNHNLRLLNISNVVLFDGNSSSRSVFRWHPTTKVENVVLSCFIRSFTEGINKNFLRSYIHVFRWIVHLCT